MKNRGSFPHQQAVFYRVTHHLIHHIQHRFPVGRDSIHESEKVGNAHIVDSGSIKVNGRIAPFLELGVGFQEELTARDNVYLYGAIMGLTKRDIDSRYEEIMDFAELKRFENMKLRNFSSGMYVRLAFSTAIQTDPDIMLVDEVLAVGDEAFSQKCSDKIDEIRRSGRTILLVSHDLEMVERLCGRCLLMKRGGIEFLGDTKTALEEYKRMRAHRE